MWNYFRKSESRWYVKWRNKGSRKIYSRRRAVYVWEQINGKLPNGYAIHHINFDKSDDRIGNLQCLLRKEHLFIHGREREDHKIIRGIEHRRCQRCRKYKTLDNFWKRIAGTFGGYCKKCSKEKLREWQNKNREKVNKYMRDYYHKQKVKIFQGNLVLFCWSVGII